jgi:hypothetical protein
MPLWKYEEDVAEAEDSGARRDIPVEHHVGPEGSPGASGSRECETTPDEDSERTEVTRRESDASLGIAGAGHAATSDLSAPGRELAQTTDEIRPDASPDDAASAPVEEESEPTRSADERPRKARSTRRTQPMFAFPEHEKAPATARPGAHGSRKRGRGRASADGENAEGAEGEASEPGAAPRPAERPRHGQRLSARTLVMDTADAFEQAPGVVPDGDADDPVGDGSAGH